MKTDSMGTSEGRQGLLSSVDEESVLCITKNKRR